MGTTTTATEGPDTPMHHDLIDLPGHRLADLIQALSGCSAGRAELEVATLELGRCVSADEALDALARVLVRLRPKQAANAAPVLDIRDRVG